MEPSTPRVPRPARMSLLLERPTTVAVQAVPIDATVHCRNRIAEFQDLLQQTIQVTYTFLLQQVPCLWRACGHPARHIAPHHFVTASTSMTATCSRVWQETEGTDKHTLRLWLVGAASRLSNVDALRVWRRVTRLLPSGGHCDQLSKTCCLQLLQLVCEVDPAKVTFQKACAHASCVLANFAAQCSGLATPLLLRRLDMCYACIPGLCATSFKVKLWAKTLGRFMVQPSHNRSSMHGNDSLLPMQITLSTSVPGFKTHMSGASRSSRMEPRLLHSMPCCIEQRWASDQKCMLAACHPAKLQHQGTLSLVIEDLGV